ncbi:RNA methyltransferase [bacterium]|nr:RNA methyltransferase [bacterium]
MRTEERLKKIKEVLGDRISNIRIAVFDIYKEHNISAILRTCDFFGIQYVDIIGKLHFDEELPLNKKVTRGVEKWLSLNYFIDSKSYLEFIRKNAYKIYVTYLDEKAVDCRLIDYSENISIVFGNEFKGIKDEHLLEHCDAKIIIPKRGFVQSLNVSVSVASILTTVINKNEGQLKGLIPSEMERLEKLWKNN